jgi:glycosyltransferase involved in cell wall biosynthesis
LTLTGLSALRSSMPGDANSLKALGKAAWRCLPRGLRRAAMTRLSAALAARPDAVPPARSQGVIVAGEMAGASGLAESARILHQVIADNGLERGALPLGLPGFVDMPAQPELAPGAALLAVVNAPILPPSLLRLPRGALRGRKVIGFWAWELPFAPPLWEEGAKFVHEIWAPSRFTADALEGLAPGRVRVVPYPLAAVKLPAEGSRADFGLPDGVFIVTTIFNLASSLARKNPLGAIAAFKAAFGASLEHLFVLKLSHVEAYGEDLALIRASIGDAPNIRLITETISEERLRGLIRLSDVVLSLHRAEGFGLIPATAMLLGRAVVATGWSGNMDFMNAETAGLVPYKLVAAEDPRGTYELAGAQWADPDIGAAADELRRLAADAPAREAMAAAGQTYAQARIGAAPLLAALDAAGVA